MKKKIKSREIIKEPGRKNKKKLRLFLERLFETFPVTTLREGCLIFSLSI